jgi:rhamnose utilization protein RhaD (predicted bifunctional aldolase and dehydrogenase)
MKSAWVERDAKDAIERYAKAGVAADLALRIYSTRLLGRDPKLVLHGGGNTSVKTRVPDLLGDVTDVLCVKGSGWDMGSIELAGMPAVRLDALRKLRARAAVADDEMVRIQRAGLIDPMAPNPSVETLLHAFVPHKFVDHTHASTVLGLIDQPDGRERAREVYGERMGIVPYILPGFGLARTSAEVFEADPKVDGLILEKHGIFTFGAEAREAYERMIEMVTRAEDRLKLNRKSVFVSAHMPQQVGSLTEIAPILRGACALKDATNDGAWTRLVLDFRGSEAIRNFVNGEDVARYSQSGVITPDHTIRTKNWPLLAPAPEAGKSAEFRAGVDRAVAAFIANYRDYFVRNNARVGGDRVMLDPAPRVTLVPGLGLFGMGRSKKEARVAADLAEAAVETITDAEATGRFQSIAEAAMFDCEYWPLEQAKLGSAKPLPLAGQIAVITGGAGAIGAATASAFAKAGAEVALLDRDGAAAQVKATAIGGAAIGIECDVTDTSAVHAAFERVVTNSIMRP